MFLTVKVTWAIKFFIELYKIGKRIVLFYAQVCFEYCKGNNYQNDLYN